MVRMSDEELSEVVLAKLRAGHGRPAIVQILMSRDLSREDATKLFEQVKTSWLREELPVRLRRAGWRNVWVGLGVCAASLVLCAFMVILARASLDERGSVRLKLLLLPGGLVILAVGQLAYAASRFRLARKAERGRLTREDMPRSVSDE